MQNQISDSLARILRNLGSEELFHDRQSSSPGDDHIGLMDEGQLVDHTGSQCVSKRYPGCPYECPPHCVCPWKVEHQRVVLLLSPL
ncbi:hypothetical protein DY000_02017535 [Brassica cretica]|uniref:Uncharacterized protein n=1 Tax=Brassica cretica TaxID=69181 RepID=A0ABQ7D0U8_BRACR|nr:hypothetical protein DY000_02017535 [Brassica cretica]